MGQIVTVLGPIAPDMLGLTSMHDHILLDGEAYRRRWEATVPERLRDRWLEPIRLDNIYLLKNYVVLLRDNLVIDDEDLMAAEMTDFRESGGACLVDMSGIGLRSDVAGIRRLSERTGVHVVATTGFYTGDSWPAPYPDYSVDQFTELMVREIEQGIEDTGVRAGHIKTAVLELTAPEQRMLVGAAHAAERTGASVTVHPGFGIDNDGRRITDILVDAGMDPKRIIIAHADGFFVEHNLRTLIMNPDSWGLNLDYHQALLDRGVNLTIDCWGHWWDYWFVNEALETEVHRYAGLIALLEAGYSSQLMLGNDTFIKMQTRRYGGGGYCQLTESVLPRLRDLGVSDYAIRQMTVENPARLLAK